MPLRGELGTPNQLGRVADECQLVRELSIREERALGLGVECNPRLLGEFLQPDRLQPMSLAHVLG